MLFVQVRLFILNTRIVLQDLDPATIACHVKGHGGSNGGLFECTAPSPGIDGAKLEFRKAQKIHGHTKKSSGEPFEVGERVHVVVSRSKGV